MQYMIYGMSGDRKIVSEDEREQLLDAKNWFDSPHKALAAYQAELDKAKSANPKKLSKWVN